MVKSDIGKLGNRVVSYCKFITIDNHFDFTMYNKKIKIRIPERRRR